jgi:nucleotide-binding universal stress UspA family protein
METILVLTDFSKAAEYAASYACTLAGQLKSHSIVLYHSHAIVLPVSEAAFMTADDESMHQEAVQNLKDLEIQIKDKIPPGVTIRHRTDISRLTEINSIAEEEGAGLIVMGTVSKTKLEEILLGSSAIAVCKNSDYPVILVPAHIGIKPVQHIVFACDMKEIEKTIPITSIKAILDDFKLPLTVLNVDDGNKHFTADTPHDTIALHNILEAYNPTYVNINNDDVVSGIIEFAKHQAATLALLISKRHNFMEGLLFRSLTRKLAYTTPFPLLILREKEQ